jgi:hypothetical protein
MEEKIKHIGPETEELYAIIDELIHKSENIDEYKNMMKTIEMLRKELESKGYNPLDYKLWHKIIGSTLQAEGLSNDTPGNDIKKYILNLKH